MCGSSLRSRVRAGARLAGGERSVVDPALTALAVLLFVASMALFVYGFRERGRERAVAAEPVIDLRDAAIAPAAAAEGVRQPV